jgi:4-hydroxybenzoate polyprenyltransferase
MSQNPTKPDKLGQVADAVKGNWVDNLAPVKLRPYLRLSRADRPVGTWLLLIPCWWGLLIGILQDGNVFSNDFWLFFSCSVGALLMRGAGCTWNDISDRKIDGAVERTRSRPIPSGQVTLTQSVIWMILQIGIAGIILLSYNLNSIILGLSSLFLVAIYPFAKRFTWWPQVFLGLAFNWGILLLFVAHSGSLSWPIVILYIAGIFWTLFYDTIYAYQDSQDDLLIGVKSTAILFGEHAKKWLFSFILLCVVLMAVSVFFVTQERAALSKIISFIGVLSFSIHLFWQWQNFDAKNSQLLLTLFRSNRNAGLIFAIFLCFAILV